MTLVRLSEEIPTPEGEGELSTRSRTGKTDPSVPRGRQSKDDPSHLPQRGLRFKSPGRMGVLADRGCLVLTRHPSTNIGVSTSSGVRAAVGVDPTTTVTNRPSAIDRSGGTS